MNGEHTVLVVQVKPRSSRAPADTGRNSSQGGASSKPVSDGHSQHKAHHKATTDRLNLLVRLEEDITLTLTAGQAKGKKVTWKAGSIVSVRSLCKNNPVHMCFECQCGLHPALVHLLAALSCCIALPPRDSAHLATWRVLPCLAVL